MQTDAAVGEILARPYARVLTREPDGRWSARVLEFPGCYTDADTPDAVVARLDEQLALVVEAMLAEGECIPVPIATTEFNGRISLRVPPELHRDAVRAAAAQGVSLNRFLSDAVARYVGALSAPSSPAAGPVPLAPRRRRLAE